MTRSHRRPFSPFSGSGRFAYLRIIALVSVSSILVILLGIYASRSLAVLNQGTDWVVHAQKVRYDLSEVLQQLVDMGGGVRRYQMTHDENSFRESEIAAAALPASLAALHQVLADDPALQPFEARLVEAAGRRVQQTKSMIDMAHAGDAAGIEAQIERGDNVAVLDNCRAVVARMQDEETKVIDQHRQASIAARDTVRFAIVATTALAVILLLLVGYVSVQHSARLQRVQNDLATTLRSIGDAVIATDAQGVVRFMNPVAEQLTGWSQQEAQGRSSEEVFRIAHEDSREPVESPVQQVLRERKIVGLSNHTVLLSRTGSACPVEDSGAPIYGSDESLVGVVLVFRDATIQRTAQRALVASEAASREADHRKDVFLAILSHELRNPLAPIRNAARLLESASLNSDEMNRSRLIISRQVRHMASLLDDLLDVSRITRGVLTLKKQTVALKALFEAAIETSRPAIDAKGHEFDVEWPDERISIEADPVRLTQIVTNLLTNSAKYTDAGGHITLGSRRDADNMIIYVRDNGIGLASDAITTVFDMFSQVAPGKGHTDGGLGIGLALVKGLVGLHGGHVEARSEGLGKGSEFLVYLPHTALDAAAAAPRAAEARSSGSSPRALRVLVADDNRDSAESLGMLLEMSGHEVQVAHDGTQALAMAAETRPDVALLDIGMPGMDGYEVAMNIRKAAWGSNMTLIAITGWGQDDNKRLARNAGFDHHLTKPMDSLVLEGILTAVEPRA